MRQEGLIGASKPVAGLPRLRAASKIRRSDRYPRRELILASHCTPANPVLPLRRTLEVRLLGRLDFDSAQALQEWLGYELSGRRDGHGVLLLCEHPPLISIGREGSRTQVLASDAELTANEIPIRWVSRSGGAIVHAPGQLAAYLLLPLDRLQLGLADFRRRFESALLDVCHELRVPAKRMEHGPGLWTRGGQVGHFGAVVKNWVSQQGMWLNVHPQPGFLRMVRSESCPSAPRDRLASCDGPDGCATLREPDEPNRAIENRVTSLQDQLLRRVSMHHAREATLRHVASVFGFDEFHLFTGHPQLQRTRRRVCIEA